ncbi:hypothetical protein BB561_003556 [Smittium simulii]|uniref:RhoGAP-domain-containing protein n=1 Tax=Smittium simulii TaxID=133385 RepID=A0A2T9YKL7_9FUNG|nr:hypothetical protein BB561_003556 [Smittium simulii]
MELEMQPNSNTFQAQRDLKLCTKCFMPIDSSLPEGHENSRIIASLKPYHLKCFTCSECNINISNGYSQIYSPDSDVPLFYCKKHYYQKADLICDKCNEPLDGLYVTGLGKKYHPNHFTCAVCPTEFGPDGTYYEYQSKAYCLNHYTYLVSSKCAGCRQPIMKLYLQIYSTESNLEERWHPECYMIHKFWNVRINPSTVNSKTKTAIEFENQSMIKEPQIYQIWTILSSFEESTATCISDMLLQVSNSMYIEGLRQAERFIMHLDVLFTAIDDLEDELSHFDDSTDLQHTREPKLLCKKIVTFFYVLSNNQQVSASNGLTQELLTLVTSLAHYLKVLIRVALKGALKAEIEYRCTNSTTRLLKKLSETSNRTKWNIFRLLYQKTDVNSDLCTCCNFTIESESIVHSKALNRWHLDCFNCSLCNIEMQTIYPNCYFNPENKDILCPKCGASTSLQPGGFSFVSQLEQYSFLMRVALKRLYSLLKYRSYIDFIDAGSAPNFSNPQSAPFKTAQIFADNTINASQNSNESSDSKAVTLARPKVFRKKSSLHETLEEVAAKRGLKNIAKTTKEDADYAFDVALQKIDDKIETKGNYIRRNNAIEQVEAMGSRLKSTSDQQNYANAERRKSKVAVVTAQTLQTRMQQAHSNSQDSYSKIQKLTPGYEKPKQLQRVKKSPNDRSEIKDLKSNSTKVPSLNNSSPKDAKVMLSGSPLLSNSLEPLKNNNTTTMPYTPQANQSFAVTPQINSKPIVPKLLQNLRINERKPTNFMSDLSANDMLLGRFAAAARLSAFNDPTRTFGISLDLLMERQGIETTLGSHGEALLNVPRFFETMIKNLSEMDLTIEGIFRKNGNIRRLREVSLAADKNDQSVNLHLDNSVQVAALLKKFLREIPEPLIPFKMRKTFLDINDISDPKNLLEALQCAILLLPQTNRDMLNVLLTFLQSVSKYSELSEGAGSKMDAKNLGTVIAPNILYPDMKESTKDDVHFKSTNDIITFIIENAPEVWQVPSSILKFLANYSPNNGQYETGANVANSDNPEACAVDLDVKDLMKKCASAGLFSIQTTSDSRTNNLIQHKKQNNDTSGVPVINSGTDASVGAQKPSQSDNKISNFDNNNPNGTSTDSSKPVYLPYSLMILMFYFCKNCWF